MVRPNDESDFWWIKPNSRAELLSTAQSRQSTTTNPQLLKSNSAREREKLDSLPISPRSSSSRFSTASQWPKAFDNSFTYTNNAKVFNGETPRLSFEENKDQQIKEIPELLNNLEMRTWQPKVRKVLYLISGELKEEKKQQQNSQQLKIKPITDKERKNQIMKINK
uniref:Uncharacterized protein n=1 Tax=Meloidogyne hapla TaxID=6305 RepID=A0A1I8B7C2_MELHA